MTKTFDDFHFHDFCWNSTNGLHLWNNFGTFNINMEDFIGKIIGKLQNNDQIKAIFLVKVA